MWVPFNLLVFLTVTIVMVQTAVLNPRIEVEQRPDAGSLQLKRDTKQQESITTLPKIESVQEDQVQITKQMKEVKPAVENNNQAVDAKREADALNVLSKAETPREGSKRDERQFGYGGYPGFGYGFPGYGFDYGRRRFGHRGRGYFGGFGGHDRSSESFEWDD